MHKIDTDTAVGNEFVDGNAAASIKATRLNAKWFNTIQRELCNIVEQAGMALSENDDGQVLRAVLELVLRTLSAGLLKQIKLKGGCTIEIDSDNGTISIFDPEGSSGISFGFNGGSEFSFTDDVSFEGGVDIMGSAKVGGDLDVKDSDGNGVQITRFGIKFKNADGSESTTKMERSIVATDQLEVESAKIASLLNVLNGTFVVKSNEARSKVRTIIQNDMSVTGTVEVQGSLFAGNILTNQIQANSVIGVWATGLYSSASQLPTDGVQTGSFAFAKNSHDVLKLYVYTGSGWTELNP